MLLNAQTALWFLPFVTPIALWVAWSDMKWMKIHNYAVLALIAVYLVVGLIALPFQSWAWGWASLAVVLVVGFVLSSVGLLGAGDAKFAAAMAPFIALGDLSLFVMLLACVTLVSFIAHRLARRTSLVQGLVPEWESLHRREFPMGLALGPSLLFYLCLATIFGTVSP
ncbi:prepilin peptidase CpaA [Roseinatronobacter thiooxidans]|jgi:prepilin peptidase CpaA|uniref:Prepilin peptidase CpaA n=1 Tax=Roseinatronobacter thiooxidans TaxID=121821 RepID=A0A2W7RJI7_9RHOB|nr:prepilin peptidase [Roseinatronobacter thiooxidans]PZX38082.1 prepilin peptidase CpaA [Roseinatronobacter thiooxidans]